MRGILVTPCGLPWSIPKILFGGIGQGFLGAESGSKCFNTKMEQRIKLPFD